MSIEKLYQIFLKSTGISTDTRTVKAGNLFFALKGPNFNGNLYAEKALESGASYVVIDEEKYNISDKYILVNNGLETLQLLANYHRKQLKIPFFAITGSNGKTTTKELLFSVLSKKYKTFATKGNLNNHIGVPLSILSISNIIEIAIIEMGANHVGELADLCRICEPTHGMITNIGLDHLEGYGSIEGVAQGNSELYYWLLKNNGIVFVNAKDEWLMRMANRFDKPILYNSIYNKITSIKNTNGLFLEIKTNDIITKTNLTGDYNLDNINVATSVGFYFGVSLTESLEAISCYQPSNNRSQVIKKGSNEIILDCYNANPSSMMVSLESFSKINTKNKIVFLGDMYELGEYAEKEHLSLIQFLEILRIEKVYFFGSEFYKHKLRFPAYHFFENRTEISSLKLENHTILIKGSRGMTMEKLVEIF
ncbi:MAG: UDP-N-acetylmuramoyl-tripeptide--D-alanyl-D-alanine ligase [Cytophagales bacterium]|nr:MAG: UDP-N-acetylmuramoyl-tripeptide--D-alanyl-D-alanine ligase [Cytophagales bacterium]